LKGNIITIEEYLENKINLKVVVVANPGFGACDLVDNKLSNLNIDGVLHIGHAQIPQIKSSGIKTIFVNVKSTIDIEKTVENAIPKLVGKNIGIVTTTQHVHEISNIKKILKIHKLNPITSKGDSRIFYKGQILGCNFSAGTNISNKINSFLFVGSGTFHPIGLLMCAKKPVVAADPFSGKILHKELEKLKDRILRQRFAAIVLSKEANFFGILISSKVGQQRFEMANYLKNLITSEDKSSIIIIADLFSASFFEGFREIDCFVSTACPRIAIDDYLQFKKPIITPFELEIVLGKRKWEDYVLDTI
jgi:2-(3-amino-3-carboxypropyl)histidine synthase